MARAASGSRFTPFNVTMRRIDVSHPSGVFRMYDTRCM